MKFGMTLLAVVVGVLIANAAGGIVTQVLRNVVPKA